MLQWDPLSGDYGPNFFGHALNTATYVVHHPEFGWLAFGGNITSDGNTVKVTPLDSFRMRVYLAPLGLWLTLDAGKFESVEMNSSTGTVRVGLAAATRFTPVARVRIEQPARPNHARSYAPVKSLHMERGAYVVPLQEATTWVELVAR
jgi:hypothetical protein